MKDFANKIWNKVNKNYVNATFMIFCLAIRGWNKNPPQQES